ncbi:hypothetical protein NUH87_30630 [Pseudomonas batumici]|uniref:hypothetical protein n=1 Tax=Pseudomonas batumici TaxID=226910 RepID=UPI0030D209FC
MNPTSRPRLTHLVVVAWLTLLTVALIALAISAAHMDAQHQQNAPNAQIAELRDHVTVLETFKAEFEAAPAKASKTDLQQVSDRWQQLWDALSQRQQDAASAASVETLQVRLDLLEQQLQAPKPDTAQPHSSSAKPRTIPVAPSFQVLGIESRGGERFLAIQPNGTAELVQVHLLRIGEAEGRWQLQALEGESALFVVDRQVRRLTLPKE